MLINFVADYCLAARLRGPACHLYLKSSGLPVVVPGADGAGDRTRSPHVALMLLTERILYRRLRKWTLHFGIG